MPDHVNQAFPSGSNRKAALAVVLACLAFFVFTACGESDPRTRVDLPGADLSELVGLLLLEKNELLVQDHGPIGLTPVPDSVSFYSGRLEPHGLIPRFELEGTGRAYVAWVPVEELSGRPETVEILISSHLVQDFEGSRQGHEIFFTPVLFKAEISPGKVAYLGEITRRITYQAARNGRPVPVVTVQAEPGGLPQALRGLLLDNPWLAERLSTPVK
ncbi:MAG: hypothetical protein V1816_12660 [Pseudomonadota bacterium]